MLPHTIDMIFPYVCFAYGAVMTIALNLPALVRIADEKFPLELVSQWKAHRVLAMVCLWVGAAWLLQNLWLT